MIRKATLDDIPSIMGIVSEAVAYLKSQGVDQWQKGFPSAKMFENDINKESCYVLCIDGVVSGVISVLFEEEMAYTEIDGSWLTPTFYAEEPYGVIHRCALSERLRGTGYVDKLFEFAKGLCLERGVRSLRIDTHEQNKPMLGVISRNGFEKRGMVVYNGSSEVMHRVAFEKIIDGVIR